MVGEVGAADRGVQSKEGVGETPGTGGFCPLADVWSPGPPRHHPAERLHHEGEAVALVPPRELAAAQGKAGPLPHGSPGVGGDFAGPVHGPAVRDLLTPHCGHLQLPHRHGGRGHVQHQAVPRLARRREGDRVGGHDSSPGTPGGRHPGGAVGEAQAQQAFSLGHHGVVAGYAEVIAVPGRHPAHPHLLRLLDSQLHGELSHHPAQAVTAVHKPGSRGLVQDDGGQVWLAGSAADQMSFTARPALLCSLDLPEDVVVVDVQPVEAVTVVAPPVRRQEDLTHDPGWSLLGSSSHQRGDGPGEQLLLPHHHRAQVFLPGLLLSSLNVDTSPNICRARHHQQSQSRTLLGIQM